MVKAYVAIEKGIWVVNIESRIKCHKDLAKDGRDGQQGRRMRQRGRCVGSGGECECPKCGTLMVRA